ncbi:MAG: Asp-tRNA(Asn)/Glu-tRNA(Gln) amidotransferase subunit GatB, partial [Alphaproteobacteria bacterium]|nr:Asp-tRNA(Asn)/Glu-tRNA(Gln) amidotransferase subunit GatB [Alphaproteobacteria bacterium]
LRCDANISLRPVGQSTLGTRTELKNINSFRYVQRALEYEVNRQRQVLEQGDRVTQETRLYDADQGVTFTMRSKEEAHDYRYFPDPDQLPITLTPEFVETQRALLPELPDEKKNRFIADYGLSVYDASVLVAERETADFFESVAKGRDAKQAANWVISELFGRLNKAGRDVTESPVSAESLGGLIDLIADNTISGSIAKKVFDDMFETGKEAAAIVEEQGLKQVTDTGAIEGIIDQVLADNPDKVAEYRGGKDKLFGFFVGQTMRASQGKANPGMVNDLLRKKLDG